MKTRTLIISLLLIVAILQLVILVKHDTETAEKPQEGKMAVVIGDKTVFVRVYIYTNAILP